MLTFQWNHLYLISFRLTVQRTLLKARMGLGKKLQCVLTRSRMLLIAYGEMKPECSYVIVHTECVQGSGAHSTSMHQIRKLIYYCRKITSKLSQYL